MMGGGKRKLRARMGDRGWCLVIIFKTARAVVFEGNMYLRAPNMGELFISSFGRGNVWDGYMRNCLCD
jgi:hypothetical protein